jgi:hypothetical protein
VRRFTIHQFVQAGLVLQNPDKPGRAINSPDNVYQISRHALKLIRFFKSDVWETSLRAYLGEVGSLKQRWARDRKLLRLPVMISPGKAVELSPGGQNGAGQEDHRGLPSSVPVNAKRRLELAKLFETSRAGRVYVTAFLSRRAMVKYLGEISWETEVWVAEDPDHMIHFNGERFLGPYQASASERPITPSAASTGSRWPTGRARPSRQWERTHWPLARAFPPVKGS